MHEAKQPTEDVVGFYACVISIIDELELLLPAAARHPAAAVSLHKFSLLAQFDALHANFRGVILTMVDLVIITDNHVAIQLFVAGLKPAIWDEMMKAIPVFCWTFFNKQRCPKSLIPFKHLREKDGFLQD